MSRHFFLLGTTPALARAELEGLLGCNLTSVTERIAMVEELSTDAAVTTFQKSGGIVKVYEEISQIANPTSEGATDAVIALLSQGEAKQQLALVDFNAPQGFVVDMGELKHRLRSEAQIALRYREVEKDGVPAALLLHHPEVTELAIIFTEAGVFLSKLLAVQDIDAWTVRDREKPYAAPKKGMLPPKVARMMVNLALARCETVKPLLYDPFCGSGTVLLEALMLEADVAGSDLDQESIVGTEQNIAWLREQSSVVGTSTVFQSDVSAAKIASLPRPVDAIVTEPFLGKPSPNASQLAGIFRGLEKMYLGAFANWRKLLKPKGVVVMVLPLAEMGNARFDFHELIDKLATKGYNLEVNPVVYSRPGATIQRQITVFRLQ